MATKTTARSLPNTYFQLVKQFPLTHIRDDRHLASAQAMIDRLLACKSDPGTAAYLDVLTDLVEAYEDEHEPIPDASEADVLQELMRSHKLSQHRLAKKVGISQSTLSSVLNGARSLTKEQIVVLSRHFNVSPLAFLPV